MRSLALLASALVLALPARAHASPPAHGGDALELPQRTPEPPRGRRLYGAGVFGVSFGVFNIAYGIPVAILCPGHACSFGYAAVLFGATFTALGAPAVHYGKRRKRVWQAWHANPSAPLLDLRRPPAPAHVPWLIVGGVTTPLALATIGLSIPPIIDPVLDTPPGAYVVLGWGAASFTAGVTMLAIAAARARHDQDQAPRVALMPSGWSTREGFGVALAGRF